MLIPPYRFAVVEDRVHRSAYPVERNLRFLKRLNLRMVLSLIPQPPSAALSGFCQAHGINLVHQKVDIYKEKNPLTDEAVVQALETIINPDNHPILVHCMNGAEVTGMVVMCLRKLQMITTSFATIEFSRFLREGIIEQEQTDFLDSFGAEIVLPPSLPPWLWQGQPPTRAHPTIKLKLPAASSPRDAQKQKSELKRKVNAAAAALLNSGDSAASLAEESYDSLALDALALELAVDTKPRMHRATPSSATSNR